MRFVHWMERLSRAMRNHVSLLIPKSHTHDYGGSAYGSLSHRHAYPPLI
jgi:hypothetical protein